MSALTLKKSQGVYMWVNDTGSLRKFNKKKNLWQEKSLTWQSEHS